MSKLISKVKEWLAVATYNIHPKLYLTLSYVHNRGRLPNFKNPKDLSEIVFSKLLSGEINNIYQYVDKVKVRDFINEWGLGAYLPKIYGVWDKFEDIDFSSFPDQFALKSNNGCGSHYICKDKSHMSIDEARSKIENALNNRTWAIAETHYRLIEPKVYCEEFLNDPCRDLPLDYKFMCCDGEIKCILVCAERTTGTRLAAYSKKWERLDYIRSYENYTNEIEKPQKLDEMIIIAEQIARKFEYIRVDLYNLGDKVYIGELTFTPEGGIMKYFNNKAISKLGHTK